LESPALDFDVGRKYIEHVSFLDVVLYGSGLRKGTHSDFELVDINMIDKGS